MYTCIHDVVTHISSYIVMPSYLALSVKEANFFIACNTSPSPVIVHTCLDVLTNDYLLPITILH